MAFHSDQLVLGSGMVYFAARAPGQVSGAGERYVGNTPSFVIDRRIERRTKKTSVRGKIVETHGDVVREIHEISFATDNISEENLNLWFGKLTEFQPRKVYGSLRFVGTNDYGPKIDYFCPETVLVPEGDFNVKNEAFQQIKFTATVSTKGHGKSDVHAIQSEYVGEPQIDLPPGFYENEALLNEVVNVIMPSRGYPL